MLVKGQVELGGQITDEGEIGVSFVAAETVVQVGNVKDETASRGLSVEGTEERHGIGTAGDCHREAEPWRQERPVDRKRGIRLRWHALMIAGRSAEPVEGVNRPQGQNC
jgi:hypothetical protein